MTQIQQERECVPSLLIFTTFTHLKIDALYLRWCLWQKQLPRGVLKKMCSQTDVSQYSQKSTCVGVSFLIKLYSRVLQLYYKRNSNTGVFREFCEIFSFIEHLWWLLFPWEVELVFLFAAQIGNYQIGDLSSTRNEYLIECECECSFLIHRNASIKRPERLLNFLNF